MTKIRLYSGEYALVDNDVFDAINKYKWAAKRSGRNVYAVSMERREGGYVRLFMHRLVTSAPKGKVVDHLNGNGLDNRRRNLRMGTQSDNQHNQRRHRQGHLLGVTKHKSGRFQAQIKVGKAVRYIGLFPTAQKAHEAYLAAQSKV